MNQPGKKLQPKLGLDISFDEALARFVQTDPAELNEAIESSKRERSEKPHVSTKKPKRDKNQPPE
jgi:hypothetical protein